MSLVMVPLPEDQVAVQLQNLVDQCRHGNNYCKQVLSLYQLSKVACLSPLSVFPSLSVPSVCLSSYLSVCPLSLSVFPSLFVPSVCLPNCLSS